MDRDIYLHIGTMKTGTTAVQYVGSRNRERLRQDGIYYPKVPGGPSHMKLALYALGDSGEKTPLRTNTGLTERTAWDGFRRSFADELREEIRGSDCKQIVLSSEHLSWLLHQPSAVRRVADLLRPIGLVKVVCYVRPQHELFLSWVSTAIKMGITRQPTVPHTGKEFQYDYETMLNLWANEFGQENIIVRVYDPKLLTGGDVVTDFFAVLRHHLGPDFITPKNLNPRLDRDTMNFLLILNEHLPRFVGNALNPERAGIVQALEAISTGPRQWTDPAVLRRIVTLYQESNAAVAARFLGRSDGILFPNLTIIDDPAGNTLSIEKAVEIAVHLWRWKVTRRPKLGERPKLGQRATDDGGSNESTSA